MMPASISFEPLLPLVPLVLIGAVTALIIMALLVMRRRGGWLRALCLGLFLLALANPLLTEEEREAVKGVLAVVVDRSASQNFGTRQEDSDQALALLQQALEQSDQFELRLVETEADSTDNGDKTQLFASLQRALADVQPSRQAGAVLITDGQVHDIPASLTVSDIQAPINALITGNVNDYDRRIHFVEAPRFGLVGQELSLSLLITDEGGAENGEDMAVVDIIINGEESRSITANIGEKTIISLTLPLAGQNIIEARIAATAGELTPRNNQTALVIDGIRENLKVLLVSGEPHNGVRLWRDLLKSDTGVDMIHFTILRPPEKADFTPVSELSLIAFPTTELFVDKIDEFDLVIMDRYQHYDVLPLIYYDYIAQYVENGGALLMATGPEYAGLASLARTPLLAVLPALPTGTVIEQPFLPQLTPMGVKHPVTNALLDAARGEARAPEWGRWLRQIEVGDIDSEAQILMQGAEDKPLLLLTRKGEGRVAMLLSDQAWLWARGFEGGGPYAALYRRSVHWLMQQRDLEEEALFASVQGHDITIRRQTMAETIETAHLTLPSGATFETMLQPDGAGSYSAVVSSDENGLVRIDNGDKSTLALVGTLQTKEFEEVVSTTEKLRPLIETSGGTVLRLRPEAEMSQAILPQIEIVAEGAKGRTSDKIILRASSDSQLINLRRVSLYPALLALIATLFVLGSLWYRESR